MWCRSASQTALLSKRIACGFIIPPQKAFGQHSCDSCVLCATVKGQPCLPALQALLPRMAAPAAKARHPAACGSGGQPPCGSPPPSAPAASLRPGLVSAHALCSTDLPSLLPCGSHSASPLPVPMKPCFRLPSLPSCSKKACTVSHSQQLFASWLEELRILHRHVLHVVLKHMPMLHL